MPNQIKRAIAIAKKTGDRIIIVDKNSAEDAFVLMNLDEYERMLDSDYQFDDNIGDLTEDELLDRINRDIAVWKNEQKTDKWSEKEPLEREEIDDLDQENLYYYEDESEDEDFERYYNEKDINLAPDFKDFEGYNEPKQSEAPQKNPWQIPPQIKKSAEEVLEDF